MLSRWDIREVIPMLSKTRIRKMLSEIEQLKIENKILAEANITLEKRLAETAREITSIKDELLKVIQ